MPKPQGSLKMVVLVFERPNGEMERWSMNPEEADALLFSKNVIDNFFPDNERTPMDPHQVLLVPGEVAFPFAGICCHRPTCQIVCAIAP